MHYSSRAFIDAAQPGCSTTIARKDGSLIFAQGELWRQARRLQQGVTSITTHAAGVSVQTWTDTFEADRVVVTVPLGVLKTGAITFTPALSTAKQNAIARTGVGTLDKVVLRFDDRWWASTLDIGVYYLSSLEGEWALWVDLTEQLGAPTILAFQGASRAEAGEALSPDDQVARALEILEEMTGQSVPTPRATAVTAWHSDAFSRGSYSFAAVGSSPGDYAELGRQEDRLHFAGEHTAFDHSATVNGAMVSGLRVADEILNGTP